MSGSKAQREALGIPTGWKVYSAFPFAGVNQSASRTAIDDKEWYWAENFLRINDGNLRTLWDAGTAFYTAPSGRTIVYYFFYNISSQQYVAIFLSDGTAVSVAYPAATQTSIATTSNTFYVAANGQLPIATQSGSQYLIIANHNTDNDYWIWDGSILYGAGSIAPFNAAEITDGGSGYTSVPGYTVFGGSGSGVVLTPVIASGSVVSLTVDNPGTGYLPGEIVQVAFTGGGSDSSAILEAFIAAGGVSGLTLVAGGEGFPAGTFTLSIAGGGGSGATGTFTVAGGSGTVTSVDLTAPGSNYTSTPVVSFPIPSSSGQVTATVGSGTIASLSVANAGAGYVAGTYPLTFVSGGGHGAAATYTVSSGGTIASTAVTNAGTSYTTTPTVVLGFGAAAVAMITQGVVASVSVISGGSGYQGTPTLTFVGGGGTDAAATAVVAGGTIASVTVTNGGSLYTSAPAVEVETGLNNAAAAVLDLMPYGVSGTSLETYYSRVWISYPNQVGKEANGGTLFISAPDSLTDFATSDGGDIFTNIDRFLRQQYTFLRQTSNFLYAVGDSSVSVVSNVQTTGQPATTTFSYQNSDPQTGTIWRDTAQDFGNTILFANAFGVYGIYGGSVRKVSSKIDDIFTNAIFPPTPGALEPTGAVANLYSQKVYCLLLTILDPFTSLPRNVMLMWNEREWFVASQSPALQFIGLQEISSDITAWGTDGTALYPLFQTPGSLAKTLATKLYGASDAFMVRTTDALYIDAVDNSAAQAGVAFSSAAVDCDGIALPIIVQKNGQHVELSCPSGSYPFKYLPNFQAAKPLGAVYGTGNIPQVPGIGLGVTLVSQSADFTMRNLSLATVDTTALR